MDEKLYSALCGERLLNEWLRQALIFRESASTLYDIFHHTKIPCVMSPEIGTPANVLSAFACELFLKGMLRPAKIDALVKQGHGHNLKILFCSLKGKTQNVIVKRVCEKINVLEKARQEAEFQKSLIALRDGDLEPKAKANLANKMTTAFEKEMEENGTDSIWFDWDKFIAELKRHATAFEKWRYAHQTGAKSFCPHFMEVFLEAIYEFCEEHKILDMQNPDF